MSVHVDITRPLATVRLTAVRGRGLDPADWDALGDAFTDLSERADVGCVVVRGIGGRAFAGGAAPSPGNAAREGTPSGSGSVAITLREVRACRHPTVAIIEGVCVGEGLEIAACCDLRVCGESSRFGAPIGGLERSTSRDVPEPLVQLLGASPMLELLRGGELIDAERARSVGLVNRVHPDRAVVEQGYGLAARIAAGAPLVNRWHKKFVRRLLERAPIPDAG